MNSAAKIAAALLLFGVAGCNHNVQSAAPAPAPPKVYTPDQVADRQLPQPPAPAEPLNVKGPGSELAQPTPPPKAAKKKSRRSRPTDSGEVQAAKETAPTSSATAPGAAAGQPPDTSPIGQLTSSSDSGSLTHQKILDLINNTERDLNEIKRPLSSDEQQTATQIRTFLTKARKALDLDDLDGANTLVTKAKVLLDELHPAH